MVYFLKGNNSLRNDPSSSALMSTNWNTLFSKSSKRKIMRIVEIKGPTQLSGVCVKTFPDPRTVTEAEIWHPLPTTLFEVSLSNQSCLVSDLHFPCVAHLPEGVSSALCFEALKVGVLFNTTQTHSPGQG